MLTFESASGRKSPTRTTFSLIFDGGNIAFCTPIYSIYVFTLKYISFKRNWPTESERTKFCGAICVWRSNSLESIFLFILYPFIFFLNSWLVWIHKEKYCFNKETSSGYHVTELIHSQCIRVNTCSSFEIVLVDHSDVCFPDSSSIQTCIEKYYFNHTLPSRFFFHRGIFFLVDLIEQLPWLIKLSFEHRRTKSAYKENTDNKKGFHCCCLDKMIYIYLYT